MQQVFYNLLSNSFKYGVRNGSVQVRITSSRQRGGFLVHYEDDGEGIPPGLEEEIFEPGFRDERARFSDVSGQGLGLAVVRSLLKVHEATIKLTREGESAFSRKPPSIFELFFPYALSIPQRAISQRAI